MRPAAGLLCFTLLALAHAPARAQTTYRVAMRDGVELATDVYLPDGPGPFPVLLTRTPYDKGGLAEMATNVVAAADLAVVVQDTRGRFASDGVDCIFRCEQGDGLADGHDTMAWIASQDWYGGPIVTNGGSALGIVQYMQAVDAPDDLAAMSVQVGTPTMYDHGFFEGGVFRQSMIEGWLEAQGSTFFLEDVAAHPTRDAFWDPVQVDDRWDRVHTPAIHLGGWYDIFEQGTIDAFRGYQHHGGTGARDAQLLVLGPWVHGGWGGVRQGELDYPASSMTPPVANLEARFLLHYAGVAPDPAFIAGLPAVQYYVMGDVDDPTAPGNEWRTAPDWPVPAAPIRQYLQPDGVLAEACPPGDGGQTSWTHDPLDPVPTHGGQNLVLPAGPYDQREVEARDDVVVFDSGPLAEPMEITGRLRGHLFVSTDAADADVVVRLSDVYPDGRSMLVTDAPLRLSMRDGPDHLVPVTPGEVMEVDVDLWSTSIILAAGHHLRVALSGSNATRFWPNPADGSSYGAESTTPTTAEMTVYHSARYPSYVELPDPSRGASEVVDCGEPTTTDGGTADADGGTEATDAGVPDGDRSSDGGCGCSAPGTRPGEGAFAGVLVVALLTVRRSRRRRGGSRDRR